MKKCRDKEVKEFFEKAVFLMVEIDKGLLYHILNKRSRQLGLSLLFLYPCDIMK